MRDFDGIDKNDRLKELKYMLLHSNDDSKFILQVLDFRKYKKFKIESVFDLQNFPESLLPVNQLSVEILLL
jgi:hypothetical protein